MSSRKPVEIQKIRQDELAEMMEGNYESFPYVNDLSTTEQLELLEQGDHSFFQGDALSQYVSHAPNGQLMSTVGATEENLYFDGSLVPSLLIHNVWCRPEYRTQGAIRSTFEKILPKFAEEGLGFASLYPFSQNYYRKFGFEITGSYQVITTPIENLPVYKYEGHFEKLQTERQEDDLISVYNQFACHYNLALERSGEAFYKCNFPDKNSHQTQKYTYLYYDESSKAKAYFTQESPLPHGRVHSPTLFKITQLGYSTPEALRAVLSFVKASYSGQYQQVSFELSSDVDPSFFIREWRGQSRMESIELLFHPMARVLDVEMVLKAANYKGDGQIAISINDPLIHKNNGVFKVLFTRGKAHLVDRKTIGDADVSMDIQAFTRLISGSVATDGIPYMENVQVQCPMEHLEQVFYKKPVGVFNFY